MKNIIVITYYDFNSNWIHNYKKKLKNSYKTIKFYQIKQFFYIDYSSYVKLMCNLLFVYLFILIINFLINNKHNWRIT